MPKFEVFERKNAKPSRDPTLTITVRGTLNLNEPAYKLLGTPEAVVLLWEPQEHVVALRPVGKDAPNSYLVRPLGKSGHSWTVSAWEFSAWIKADLSAARRYPLKLEDGLGCADLNGPVTIVGGNRGSRRQLCSRYPALRRCWKKRPPTTPGTTG